MTAADVVVIIGFALAMAGMTAAFGWPWAAMLAGVLVIACGAKMQHAEKGSVE